MYKGHPWEKDALGPLLYELQIKSNAVMFIHFDVNLKPFIDFCQNNKYYTNQLTIKILSRLSKEFLPQYVISLNNRAYPSIFPVSYITRNEDISNFAINLEENDRCFKEVKSLKKYSGFEQLVLTKFPKIIIWMLKHFFPAFYVKKVSALTVTRNYLRSVGGNVYAYGNAIHGMILSIPFGYNVTCSFTIPHAFGRVSDFEEFIAKFKQYMEDPQTIAKELREKPYYAVNEEEEAYDNL